MLARRISAGSTREICAASIGISGHGIEKIFFCVTNVIYCAGAQRRRFLFRIWSFKRSRVYPSVRPMFVRKKRAKHRMVSAPASLSIYNGDFFSRFSRCRRKVRLRGEGMICRDPKKVDFFQNLNHSNYAYIRRPRTIRSSLQPS